MNYSIQINILCAIYDINSDNNHIFPLSFILIQNWIFISGIFNQKILFWEPRYPHMFRYLIPLESGVGFKHFHISGALENSHYPMDPYRPQEGQIQRKQIFRTPSSRRYRRYRRIRHGEKLFLWIIIILYLKYHSCLKFIS